MELNLRGFIVSVHAPSEDYLTVAVDCTELPSAVYIQLVSTLQDVLAEVDERYAKGKARIRSLRAKYKREMIFNRLTRRRILRFSPLPTRFSNELRYVRTVVYGLVANYCITIQQMRSGRFERNLYLLPNDFAEGFVERINIVNYRIDELNRRIERFDVSRVVGVLERFGVKMSEKSFHVPRVSVDLMPVSLDDRVVAEWVGKSPAVAEVLAAKRREIIVKAVESIKAQVEPIVKAIAEKKKLYGARERLEALKRIAESAGLKALSDSVIAPFIVAVENPEEFTVDLPRFLDERVGSLLASL